MVFIGFIFCAAAFVYFHCSLLNNTFLLTSISRYNYLGNSDGRDDQPLVVLICLLLTADRPVGKLT